MIYKVKIAIVRVHFAICKVQTDNSNPAVYACKKFFKAKNSLFATQTGKVITKICTVLFKY